jgi:hypothetical protein
MLQMLRLQLKMPFMTTCRERDMYLLSSILGGAESLQQGFDAWERLGIREFTFLGFMEFGGI